MQLQAMLKTANAGKTYAEINVQAGDADDVFKATHADKVFVTLTYNAIRRHSTELQPLGSKFALANENTLIVSGNFNEIREQLLPAPHAAMV